MYLFKNKLFLSLGLLFILITSGCGESAEQIRITELETTIADLDQRVLELEAKSVESETASLTETNDPTKINETTEIKEEIPLLTEYAFESCQKVNEYTAQTWFNAFKKSFETVYASKPDDQVYPNFTKLTEACYSSIGNVFITLQPATNLTTGFHMFKYDIKTDKLAETTIKSGDLNSGFPTPTEFARRDGAYINMFGYNSDTTNCKITSTFKYDYINNQLLLKENCSKCGTEAETCKSY
jgi:hypothetical protein